MKALNDSIIVSYDNIVNANIKFAKLDICDNKVNLLTIKSNIQDSIINNRNQVINIQEELLDSYVNELNQIVKTNEKKVNNLKNQRDGLGIVSIILLVLVIVL